MDMIERVARTVFAFEETELTWESTTPRHRRLCEKLAKATIEAMRDPSQEMKDAARHELQGCRHDDFNLDDCVNGIHVWHGMIDAALEGE